MADHLTLLDSGTDPAGDVVAPGADPHQRATAELAVEQRFAVVPEWMLDSTVSDTAFRLYAILARYGNTSGVRMPGRALLARRLHRSVDTVDRALKELTAAGILSIERRSHDGRNLTNRYHLRTHDPDGAPGSSAEGDSRSFAATPTANLQAQDTGNRPGGRTVAAVPRRSSAARVAAALRPNPDVPTETPPPPTTPAPACAPPAATGPTTGRTEEEDPRLGPNRPSRTVNDPVDGCSVGDLAALAATVQGLRRDLGRPSVRWSAPCLATAIDFATKVRGWPAQHARHALLLIAADPQTRSPMRLAEAGPWWDHAQQPRLARTPHEQAELDGLEATLADADDRAQLQHHARQQLTTEGEPVTRLTVARRAARLLEKQVRSVGPALPWPPQKPLPSTGIAGEAGVRRQSAEPIARFDRT